MSARNTWRLCAALTLAALLLGLCGLAAGSSGWSLHWSKDWPLIAAIRAPRTLGAFLAGNLLGLGGAIAQGLFRNPLADAQDIAAKPDQVRAAVELLDGGATVPFIARYRKEATGGLDDTQLRMLEERLRYLRELEERREAILASIEEQGKLSDALKGDILAADTKARLEDLYLPYKPKRRTKAQIAREAGLEPLAVGLRERSHAIAGSRGRILYRRRKRCARYARGARRRTRHLDGKHCRRRATARRTARLAVGERPDPRQGGRRQGKRRREIPRLFRPHGSDRQDSLAPPARA